MADHQTEVISEEKNAKEKLSWKPFLRQLLVCSGVWTSHFVYGLVIGAPTVFIPQIRREANSTEAISDEMASWLSSVIGFSALPCIIIFSILTRLVGRKISFILSCIDTFVAFLIFFWSATVFQMLVSQILQGLFAAGHIVVSVMILTEYISPRYRGLFLIIKATTLFWGIWTANFIGTFFHWKKIGMIGILCAAYSVITPVFIWPESPYWLASKERYKECAASHRWLKGCDDESEKELEALIRTQKEYIRSHQSKKQSRSKMLKGWYVVVTAKQFYKPTLISFLSALLIVFSGKLICTVYAIDIMKKITGNESIAYTAMLILDGVTITSMCVGCVLSIYLKRRTMLLVASSISVLFLFILSLYLYLIQFSVIMENNYVSVSLLLLFTIAVSCGPLIMSTSVYGELIPIRSRDLAVCLIVIMRKMLYGITLKVAPYIFKTFGLHGTFLGFGISSSVVVILLYIYLPETKDKTLQEITDSIEGVTGRTSSNEEALNLMIPKTESCIESMTSEELSNKQNTNRHGHAVGKL